MFKKLMTCAVLVVVLTLLGAVGALAETKITFYWDANTEADLKGYKLYYGNSSGEPYAEMVDVGKPPIGNIAGVDHPVVIYSLVGLVDGDWWFALTAYDNVLNESGYSVEVSTLVDTVSPSVPGLHIEKVEVILPPPTP